MRAPRDTDWDFADLGKLPRSKLREVWQTEFNEKPPACFGRELLALGIAYARQEHRYGGFRKTSVRELDRLFTRALGEKCQCAYSHSNANLLDLRIILILDRS